MSIVLHLPSDKAIHFRKSLICVKMLGGVNHKA